MDKIVFICSCIEPGKDGVGDYVYRLACELRKADIKILILALHDRFITDEYKESDFNGISICRMPQGFSWAAKTLIGRNLIQNFAPCIISFQLVPFAFNPYGILRKEYQFFLQLAKGYKSHIMFHELWIGDSVGSSFKDFILGFLERRYILQFIRKLKPEVIHTSCGLFVFLLKNKSVESVKLPVFSNIPKELANDYSDQLLYINSKVKHFNKKDYWIFTFFGTIHPEWKSEKVMNEIARLALIYKKKILITSIGKTNETIWDRLRISYSEKFEFVRIGEKSSKEISRFLQVVDFALTSYPDILIEKSGSVAALIIHKIPVVYSRDELEIPNFNIKNDMHPLIINISNFESVLKDLLQIKNEDIRMFELKHVADKFLKDIKQI